jgi:REP element-mobilizing transposase RayT
MRLDDIREWLKNKPTGRTFQAAVGLPETRFPSKKDFPNIVLHSRRLPHWELQGSTYFLTFRTHEAIGAAFQDHLIADIVEESIWFGHPERYILQAYVIMPNHIHLLLGPVADWNLAKILQGLKGFTAREINRKLGRRGAFWQDENFDHLIRNEQDWSDKFDYIHDNPVTAGLVTRAQDNPYSSLVTIYSNGRLESLPHN